MDSWEKQYIYNAVLQQSSILTVDIMCKACLITCSLIIIWDEVTF
jgi:hypothetical protein